MQKNANPTKLGYVDLQLTTRSIVQVHLTCTRGNVGYCATGTEHTHCNNAHTCGGDACLVQFTTSSVVLLVGHIDQPV